MDVVTATTKPSCSSTMAALLTNELWMDILSFLHPRNDLLRSVSLVSKNFGCTILSKRSYWKHHIRTLLTSTRHNEKDEDGGPGTPNTTRNSGSNDGDGINDNTSRARTTVCTKHVQQVEILEQLSLRQLQRYCAGIADAKIHDDLQKDQQAMMEDENPNQGTEKNDRRRAIVQDRLQDVACPNRSNFVSLLPTFESLRQFYAAGPIDNQMHSQQHLRRQVCLASTTDNPTEILENALASPVEEQMRTTPNFARIFARIRDRWWSSKPTNSPDTNEVLLFCLDCPLAMIKEINLRHLLDPYSRDRFYTWKYTDIKVYQLPIRPYNTNNTIHIDSTNTAVDIINDESPDSSTHNGSPGSGCRAVRFQPGYPCSVETTGRYDDHFFQPNMGLLEHFLTEETPVFERNMIPTKVPPEMSSTGRGIFNVGQDVLVERLDAPNPHILEERFTLPHGVLGNVVCFVLRGKNTRQFDDATRTSGYYSCLQHVKVMGYPIVTESDGDIGADLENEE